MNPLDGEKRVEGGNLGEEDSTQGQKICFALPGLRTTGKWEKKWKNPQPFHIIPVRNYNLSNYSVC